MRIFFIEKDTSMMLFNYQKFTDRILFFVFEFFTFFFLILKIHQKYQNGTC